ncbi:hypothetical protein D3C80_1667050 [compost metagenome]
MDIEVDGRVLLKKPGKQLRQVFGQRCGVAQQSHLALQALGVLPEVELQAFDLLGDQPGMLQQRLSRRRGLHATAVAFEQRCAQRTFHGADARAGCRQRQVAALGAGGDVAALQGVLEQSQVNQIEMHQPLPGQ